jgi:heat shock protein HtpX
MSPIWRRMPICRCRGLCDQERPTQRLCHRPQSGECRGRRVNGLLESLTEEEIAAVMAHELAHVQHRDTLTMTITATLGRRDFDAGQFRAVFWRKPQQQPARLHRHPGGDHRCPVCCDAGADDHQPDPRICGRPARRGNLRQSAVAGLGAAQDRAGAGRIVNEDAERNPATAHMFIINPLNGQRMDSLFSTHPATENRIAALEAMAR